MAATFVNINLILQQQPLALLYKLICTELKETS
jgi:hypothetical protein